MGDTSRQACLAGGVDAVERVFGHGGTSPLCGPSSGRGSMSDVCREFGISRKTGYKIFNRYRQEGLDALCDRSRRPVRYANQLPEQVERLIVALKRDKPHWGARKIRELLIRKLAGDLRYRPRARCMPCSTAMTWSSVPASGVTRRGNIPVPRPRTQRSVVRRLQGRVQARQRPLLLPPDGDGPGCPLCSGL